MITISLRVFLLCLVLALYVGGFLVSLANGIKYLKTHLPIEKTDVPDSPMAYWYVVIYASVKNGLFWPINIFNRKNTK